MATAKTSTFFIREAINIDAAATTDSMDLSMYCDPVNRQGLLIRNADFIWYDGATYLPAAVQANTYEAAIQLHAATLGALAEYDNNQQIASASIQAGANLPAVQEVDFFPDRLGMTKGEGRITVNDTLEIVADGSANVPANLECCIVLECQVVKLSKEDYVSLALQSVADA